MSPAARRAGVLAFFVALGAALTWPMVATFTSRLGGDGMDSQQTLWGHWWFKECIYHLRSPFFTPLQYHPHGVTMVFQSWSWVDAALALPLWPFLPPYAVENTLVLLGMTTTGLGMYALVRDLTGRTDVALFAGAAYVALPFHVSHLVSQFHLVPLGWVPLYLMFFLRVARGGGWRDALLGGLCLGLGALTSWYQVIFAAGLTLAVALHLRRALLTGRILARAALLGVVFLALAGPLLVAMRVELAREPFSGAHDPAFWSADLQSFFLPNGRSIWSSLTTSWQRWTGNPPENGNYLGVALTVLALASLRRSGLARALGVVALGAVALAIGPDLHVGGRTVAAGVMPYAFLERVLPFLAFSGNPGRFAMVAETALVVMAALALREARRRALVAVAGALLLVELWPMPMAITRLPAPAPMLEWARSHEDFAVLDVSGFGDMMWHSTLHGHPMMGGYVTRYPARLEREYRQHPAVLALTGIVGLDRARVLGSLRAGRIRYVVTRADNAAAARLRLDLVWDQEGIRIYQVPD